MYLSKRSFQIQIQPWDNAVNQALNIIKQKDPQLIKNVKRIIVHSGGGSGQLGHVEMGPGKDPQEIHIFKDRIKNIVIQQAGGNQNKQTLTPQELEHAIVMGLTETIIHESAHIGKNRTYEQILQGPFLGEGEAEREAKQFMQKLQNENFQLSKKSSKIYNILHLFHHIHHNDSEHEVHHCGGKHPNFNYNIEHCKCDKHSIDKEQAIGHTSDKNLKPFEVKMHFSEKCPDGGWHIESGKIEKDASFTNIIINELIDSDKFNKQSLNSKRSLNLLGIIASNVDLDQHFPINLASWQYDNDLDPTGKLDNKTISKFAELKPNLENLPRNFAIVSPNLYRGGIIDSIEQLQALKDMGVKRIVSLHNSPQVSRMCGKLNMEHIPAYITNGKPHELGRKIFGNSVTNIIGVKPTYVHCYYGHDRTGGIIARYRVENGWDPQLAYKEAKSFGFKDMFTDLIDWFSNGNPPIDTNKIRKTLNYEDPYEEPMEQDCFTPMPDDIAFQTDLEGYTGEVTKLTPSSINTIPIGLGSV